jgi:hypothetical protein
MKSNIVRLFVVTLALAGFGATAMSAHTAKAKHLTTKSNSQPMPMCLPSNPTYCGMTEGN